MIRNFDRAFDGCDDEKAAKALRWCEDKEVDDVRLLAGMPEWIEDLANTAGLGEFWKARLQKNINDISAEVLGPPAKQRKVERKVEVVDLVDDEMEPPPQQPPPQQQPQQPHRPRNPLAMQPFQFGPNLKSTYERPYACPKEGLEQALREALLRTNSTWCWHLVGVGGVINGVLRFEGDKTQVCHSMCGPLNKSEGVIAEKKFALASSFASGVSVPSKHTPIGAGSGAPVGTKHDWLYVNLDAATGAQQAQQAHCEMLLGGLELRLHNFRWREEKQASKWTWTWTAKCDDAGLNAGPYLIFADQRAVDLYGQRGSKPYHMRMVGQVMPLNLAAPLANIRPAAATLLNQLIEQMGRQANLSGGNNNLGGYGTLGGGSSACSFGGPGHTLGGGSNAGAFGGTGVTAATAPPQPQAAPASWRTQLTASGWGSEGLLRLLPQPSNSPTDHPRTELVLRAFQVCPPVKVRAVIVGKFPYNDAELAHGVALSVPAMAKKPQTLTHYILPHLFGNEAASKLSGDLTRLSEEAGVLLLNASLQGRNLVAWRPFLSAVIRKICADSDARGSPVGFLLMGNEAQALAGAVTGPSRECLVTSQFPAQYTRDNFNRQRPFAELDNKLKKAGAQPIEYGVLLR